MPKKMGLWQPFTELNKLEISLNRPLGTSGHDFLVNVDFQGKNDEVIDQTVRRV
jgi:hypothetical protein